MDGSDWIEALKFVVIPNMLILVGVLALGWDLGLSIWAYLVEAVFVAFFIVANLAFVGIKTRSMLGTFALALFGLLLLIPAAVLFSVIAFLTGFTGQFPLPAFSTLLVAVAPLVLVKIYLFATDLAKDDIPVDTWSAASNVFGLAAKAIRSQIAFVPVLLLLALSVGARNTFPLLAGNAVLLTSGFVLFKTAIEYRIFKTRNLTGIDLFVSLFQPRKRQAAQSALEIGKRIYQEGQQPGMPPTGSMEQFSYGKGKVFIIRKSEKGKQV